ncbi:MAG: VOC family protein [Candidatus Helarchaeota archaeon]
MKFNHYAILSNSEEESDKFYMELLGMDKAYSFIISKELMNKIFSINEELKVIRYKSKEIDIEVFISNKEIKQEKSINHLGIVIENRDVFYQKAKSLGVDVIKIDKPQGNGYYLFIKDFFGNIFEIQE